MTDNPQADRPVAYRSPGTRTLYCVICARQESGWQPVAAADVQDWTGCDFCGGPVLAVASQSLGAVVARHLTDRAAEPRPPRIPDHTVNEEQTAAEEPSVLSAADRAAIIAEILPAWEAVYEPGNVSDYLIGYANSEATAKGAAEAWLRSEKDEPGRLEWVAQEALAVGEHDQEFELVEFYDDGTHVGPGITVRHRTQKPTP